ncbi:hypothetical protein Acr_00g0020390 [Actinidia rufa]|uniref:Uncharacterized protein n=1 Tax=Actinidia rufa TaxID=165716 RepID=A0A7J0DC01_9ERIC|nr:hypothetical protein Acr_00g0020390 [Actinidia rufa]
MPTLRGHKDIGTASPCSGGATYSSGCGRATPHSLEKHVGYASNSATHDGDSSCHVEESRSSSFPWRDNLLASVTAPRKETPSYPRFKPPHSWRHDNSNGHPFYGAISAPKSSETHQSPHPYPPITLVQIEMHVRALIQTEKSPLPLAIDLDLRPPYSLEVASSSYLEEYGVPKFVHFDGRKGNAKEHIICNASLHFNIILHYCQASLLSQRRPSAPIG